MFNRNEIIDHLQGMGRYALLLPFLHFFAVGYITIVRYSIDMISEQCEDMYAFGGAFISILGGSGILVVRYIDAIWICSIVFFNLLTLVVSFMKKHRELGVIYTVVIAVIEMMLFTGLYIIVSSGVMKSLHIIH